VTPKRIVVGITGATGSIIGVRLLEILRDAGVETHLIMSKWGARTLIHETSRSIEEVNAIAAQSYNPNDQGASVSSGSFLTDGMVIAPCSMRTLGAIASGQGEHLVHRAADVILKERRKLVLVVRESPLHEIHLENMLKLARMGVTILPPMPAFYNHPQSVPEMVDNIVMRILDQFGIHTDLANRWDGKMAVGDQLN
jgi:4-hydroxy-3-polyprenylbenzoate decarboxylase